MDTNENSIHNHALLAHTAFGDLLGTRSGSVIQFRGVPYAEPPVGELSFSLPRTVLPWTGIRYATQHGPISVQAPSRLRNVMGDFSRPISEDCLTLTISTPAADQQSRPVLVFFHGGAFVSGAGSLDWYDGSTLSGEGDIVVVTVNYRLGVYGFLCQPGISDGNLGVYDMIAALKWVKENIGSFGGNPESITVMGQSAGAHTIMCLLTMPDVRRLFKRAIIESAPAGLPPFTTKAAIEIGNKLLGFLGIDRANANVESLRKIPHNKILESMGLLMRSTARFGQITPPFMPVFDDLSSVEAFVEKAGDGAGAEGIDVIIGTTREESNAFFVGDPAMQNPDPAIVDKFFERLTGKAESIELYRKYRPGGKITDLLSDVAADYATVFPSLKLAERVAKAGANAWVYQFDWAPAGSPFKACHCIELPFVFGNRRQWADSPMIKDANPDIFDGISAAIRATWICFVRTGKPAANNLWPTYDVHSRLTMRFDSVSGPVGDLAGIEWRGI